MKTCQSQWRKNLRKSGNEGQKNLDNSTRFLWRRRRLVKFPVPCQEQNQWSPKKNQLIPTDFFSATSGVRRKGPGFNILCGGTQVLGVFTNLGRLPQPRRTVPQRPVDFLVSCQEQNQWSSKQNQPSLEEDMFSASGDGHKRMECVEKDLVCTFRPYSESWWAQAGYDQWTSSFRAKRRTNRHRSKTHQSQKICVVSPVGGEHNRSWYYSKTKTRPHSLLKKQDPH